jgi:hypothetical protein
MNLEVSISDSFSLSDIVDTSCTADIRVTSLYVEVIYDGVSSGNLPLHKVSMMYVEALVDSISDPWLVFEA